ncbi:MAG TPA: carbohydrate-binding family 9-like protein [Chthonomonadaceae bacterium]|nr:carbohydrate-binding family 9-like protein [Chthonomonadaceae bacterium]
MNPKSYLCYRTDTPLELDGRLDKPAWQSASWTDDFVDIEGDLKPLPRFRTRVKMLWDDAYLYIGAEMEEPHVWATLAERDSIIFQDNDFEVFLDPDGDNHQYYELEINALNTVWDLLLIQPYRDGGPAVHGWNIVGLQTAVHVEGTLNDPTDQDQGWSVEMALPWKALAECAHCSCPPLDGDQWRINFSRVQWETEIRDGKYRKVEGKREDNWVWSPQGMIDMHRPEQWGIVQFSTAPAGSAVFSPDPALPARDLLHRIYYTQREYRRQQGHWTSDLEALGCSAPLEPPLLGAPRIELTTTGFLATVVLALPDGTTQSWHIRDDSRIWPTPTT